jgi:hypothetical protein
LILSASIDWKPVTMDSTVRNIRPIVVAGEGYRVLLWLRGPWETFTNYHSDVVGIVKNMKADMPSVFAL